MHHSKVRVNEAHQIAIALGGYSPAGIDEAKVLDNELTETASLPDDFAQWVEGWANKYVASNPETNCSLLIVHPKADQYRVLTLPLVKDRCRAVPNPRSVLHPDPTNPANFWPQYFRCDQRPNLQQAIYMAAVTVLMAAGLNPFGVSGLELLQYSGDRWRRFKEKEVEAVEDRCLRIRGTIEDVIGA